MPRPGLGWRTLVGVAEETVWGSGGTVDSYFPVNSESLVKEEELVQSDGLYARAGKNKWSQGTVNINGDLEFDVQPEGYGKIFKHALGYVDTATDLGDGVYSHVIRPSGILPSGLKVEIDRDKRVFTYPGCKVDSMEMTGAINENLMTTVSLLGKTEIESASRTVTNPDISTLDPFVFHEGALTVAGTSTPITAFTLTVNNNLDDSHYVFNRRLRRSIHRAGFREVTGSLTMVFEDVTAYNLFTTKTPAALQLLFTSDALPGGENYKLQIDIPEAVYTGTTPTVDGPGVITHELPFTAFRDDEGTYNQQDELRITLTNTESSL